MRKKILYGIVMLFFLCFFSLFFLRAVSHSEIDDISPEIFCEKECIEKSDVLWVVPKFNGIPISENKTWCKEILKLNKTLGLHGVTHEYHEFGIDRSDDYIVEGIKIFEECFGFKPLLFKPPQLFISKNNKKLIEKYDLELKVKFNQVIHKVYHCNDTGVFSNYLIDIV